VVCVERGVGGTGRWFPEGGGGVIGRRSGGGQWEEIMGWIVFEGGETNGW
jgi:hypothetical protein